MSSSLNVQVGDEIPSWVMPAVSAEKMKTMAAILRDPNPVHWDPAAVARRGLGEHVINQGPLGVGYMVNMLHAWAGENCIRRLFIRFPFPVIFDEDHITARGRVTRLFEEDGEARAECDVWLERDGQRGLIEGTAFIALPG